MPGAESIDMMKAAQADALAAVGYNPAAVGRATGLHPSSVRDVLHRVGHWGEVAQTPVFKRLRSEQSIALESAGRVLAAKAMLQCEETLPKANAYQSCLIASIMIDKSRLLAGESTENISVHNTVEIHGLDQLADALSRRLITSSTESNSNIPQSNQASADLRNEGERK